MENITTIRFELEVAAQKVISQYMINNEHILKELEEGVKNAFENIDLPKLIEINVKKCIEKAIQDSSDWGKIRESVRNKADEIVDKYIDSSIKKFKSDFKKIKES